MTDQYEVHGLARGVPLATVAAGPAFLIGMGLGQLGATADPVTVGPAALGLPLLLFPAIVVGAVLSILPILIGGYAMAWIGQQNAALRLAPAWALAGALTAGLLGLWFEIDPDTMIALGATGAICALVCRRYVRWE